MHVQWISGIAPLDSFRACSDTDSYLMQILYGGRYNCRHVGFSGESMWRLFSDFTRWRAKALYCLGIRLYCSVCRSVGSSLRGKRVCVRSAAPSGK